MLDALETFLAVATAGNFSEVARRQDVAVSSITRKIDALEKELGSALFHRSPRRVTLTDAGEQLLPRARNVLGEFAQAREAIVHANDSEPRGQLTVSAPTVFGRLHVVGAVGRFLRRYPDIEVDLHLCDQILDLSEHRMDVALRIGVLPDSDLQATTLAQVRLVTCASPAYLGRAGRPTRPEDLLQHNCITPTTLAPCLLWRYAGVNRNKPLPVRGDFRTDGKDGMLQAALEGIGVIHIATWVVSEHLRSGALVALFPQEEPTPGLPGIHAVRLPGRSHAAKSRLFIDHLRAEIGEDMPWWDRLQPAQEGSAPEKIKSRQRVSSF